MENKQAETQNTQKKYTAVKKGSIKRERRPVKKENKSTTDKKHVAEQEVKNSTEEIGSSREDTKRTKRTNEKKNRQNEKKTENKKSAPVLAKDVIDISKYLLNLDLQMLNSDSIKIILEEMRGNETDLVKLQELTRVFDEIVAKASLRDCMDLFKGIDLTNIVFTKSGAKVIEYIMERVFSLIYTQGTKFESQNEDNTEGKKPMTLTIENILAEFERKFTVFNYDTLVANENSTFLLRKLMMLFTAKMYTKTFFGSYKHPDAKFIKTFKKKFSNDFTFDLKSSLSEFITLSYYVKITESQKFMKMAIDEMTQKLGTIKKENKKNDREAGDGEVGVSVFFKDKDMFYETVLEHSNVENSVLFVEAIKPHLMSLVNSYNYLVQKILKKSTVDLSGIWKLNQTGAATCFWPL